MNLVFFVSLGLLLIVFQDVDLLSLAESALSKPSPVLFKIKEEITKNNPETKKDPETEKKETNLTEVFKFIVGHWRNKPGGARAPTGFRFLPDGSVYRTNWILDMSVEGVRFDSEEKYGKWTIGKEGDVIVDVGQNVKIHFTIEKDASGFYLRSGLGPNPKENYFRIK